MHARSCPRIPSSYPTGLLEVHCNCLFYTKRKFVQRCPLSNSSQCNFCTATTLVRIRRLYYQSEVISIGGYRNELAYVQLKEWVYDEVPKEGPEFEPCRQPAFYSRRSDRISVRYDTFLSDRKLFTSLNRLLGHIPSFPTLQRLRASKRY